MLMDADAIVRATEYVDDTMFYREGHRRMFRAMVSVSERGEIVDPLTLAGSCHGTASSRPAAERTTSAS